MSNLDGLINKLRNMRMKPEDRDDVKTLKCPDSQAAYDLRYMMRDISEQYWAAGWLIGLEFMLWEVALGIGPNDDLMQCRQQLFALAMKCNGWWMWDKDSIYEKFVTLDEWVGVWSSHKGH